MLFQQNPFAQPMSFGQGFGDMAGPSGFAGSMPQIGGGMFGAKPSMGPPVMSPPSQHQGGQGGMSPMQMFGLLGNLGSGHGMPMWPLFGLAGFGLHKLLK